MQQHSGHLGAPDGAEEEDDMMDELYKVLNEENTMEENEIYEMVIDGTVEAAGTFGDVVDAVCKARMHGCYFLDPGESVIIRRRS